MEEFKPLLKRLAQIGLVVLLLLLGFSAWNYFNSGVITVQTTVSRQRIALTNTVNGEVILEGEGIIRSRLKPGRYIAAAEDNSASTLKIINVRRGESTKHTLARNKTASLEPVVSGGNASGVAAGQEKLTYLDGVERILYSVDSQNKISVVDVSSDINSVKWASANYGVGRSANGLLFVVDGAQLKKLDTPFTSSSEHPGVYAISPDQTIYVSSGRDLYQANPGEPPKKIYTHNETIGLVAAGINGNVALTNGVTNEGSILPQEEVSLTLLSKGRKLGSKKIPVYTLAWSSDGKKLAAGGPSLGHIFNESFVELAAIPNPNATNFTWLSPETLAYSVDGQLWKYNLSEQESVSLLSNPSGNTINELALSSDSSYLYMSISSDNGSDIKRLGLRGQKVYPDIYKLDVFLPMQLDQCEADFVNLTAPSVVLKPVNASLADECLLNARENLRESQIDVSRLSFVISDVQDSD